MSAMLAGQAVFAVPRQITHNFLTTLPDGREPASGFGFSGLLGEAFCCLDVFQRR